MTITFGRNAQQYRHAFRHVIEAGLNSEQIQELVMKDLKWRAAELTSGPHTGTVLLKGVSLEYRAFQFEDGSINVGRITLV